MLFTNSVFLPFLLLADYRLCLAWTLGNAILIILMFNYYVAVARDLSFRERFWEMVAVSLGVAAVLFVGLGFGALDPDLKLPDVVYNLGLVLFVYTIGLSSGSVFFGSMRRQGLKSNLLVFGMLLFAGGLAAASSSIR